MDKDKFISWLKGRKETLIYNISNERIQNINTNSYIRAVIATFDDIEAQVKSGRFDSLELRITNKK
ncbi:MAG: hypothetical protein QXG00_07880 [Candidatus Woesearchaeota archaeon]